MPSAYRWSAAMGWLLYMTWVAYYWVGLTGVGLVCVLSTRWLLALSAPQQRQFRFDPAAVDRIWVMPFAVNFRCAGECQWLFRDETGPAQWAALLRQLRQLQPSHV